MTRLISQRPDPVVHPRRAGGDVKIALLGPGVGASHNYERTHKEALLGTTQLILAYLLAP